MSGIESVLGDPEKRDLDLYIEYMDTKRFPTALVFPPLRELYARKYAHARPDVIITTDDDALNFMLAYGDSLFPDAPVVFCGPNSFEEARIAGHDNYTGVVEEYDLASTIALALRLHPKARHVAAVTDVTSTGKYNLDRLHKVEPLLAGKADFIELSGLSTKELQDALHRLPADTVVLHLSFYRDRDGKSYTVSESTRLIKDSTELPLYSCWDFMLGNGIIGGKMVSGAMQGATAAEMALRILDGTPVKDIPVLKESPNRFMFDYPALLRAGLDVADLPEGSAILNRPVSYYQLYKNQILAVAVGMVAMLALIVAMGVNILLRRRAQRDLRESEERFRALVDQAQDAIFVHDLSGRFLLVNQRACDVLGYGRKELSSLSVADVDPDFEARNDPDTIWGNLPRTFESRHRKKDGGMIPVEIRLSKILYGSQEVLHAAVRDITERKRAEEGLKSSEKRLAELVSWKESILNNSAVGILVVTQHRIITEVNFGFTQIFGYESKEVVGKSVKLIHVNNTMFENFGQQYWSKTEESNIVSVEWRMRRKNGEIFWCELSGCAMNKEDILQGVVWVIKDINERKQTQDALEQAREELEQRVEQRTKELRLANERLLELDQLKNAFLATVSHDLRTPLTSILGFAKLIHRDFERRFLPLAGEDEMLRARGLQIAQNMAIIEKEGERLTRLINDFLDLAKIEAGSMEWRDQDISPALIIERSVQAVRGEIEQNPGLALMVDAPPDLPLIRVDPDRLVQVIVNLLSNAIKFTSAGRIGLDAKQIAGGRMVFRVTDTGVGIAAPDIPRIFDKFFQASRKDLDTISRKGTGLGLAICKTIIEHYGGCITVESQLGQGSSFVIDLPLGTTG
ncbi:PAS domain S-box protein [Desulfolutivibrio sulfoxidireducens]|uniref:PAS domain S-box protein n=1 Tax=Desulfolutivibrio sulfoxidireducens TaxID=2773299 RepID=UPI00159DD958|nr:PAS domain S-box protein [Desulfolutivibrio sulfoxidireducens]